MRNTAQYILKRLLYMNPMVLVITFLIYGGLELTPGDAISHMIPPDQLANVNPEQLEALRESYGLNDPFLLRYVRWLGELLHGNFGYSITSGVPIKDILLQLFPATLELSLAALAISSVLGSILGILSALKKGSIGDNVLTVFGMIGVSIPQFFFGMLCILVFALDWAILPIGGRMAPGETGIWNHFKYLILPASVLGISLTAGVMRYSRSSMLDTMNKDYIKTARAKGLPGIMQGSVDINVYGPVEYVLLALVILSTTLVIVALITVVSTLAKSVKEATMFLTPLMIVVMLVGVLGMFGDAKAEVAYYLVPLYNSVQCMIGIFSFDFQPLNVAVCVIANLAYAGVGVLALQRMFDSERLMFAR